MPRRHERPAEPEPLAITAADIPRPPKTREQREVERREREDQKFRRNQERRKLERTVEMDWDTCLVPFCEAAVYHTRQFPKDADVRLPLCSWHEAMVWRTVQRSYGRQDIYEATVKQDQAQRIRDEAEKKRRLAQQDGHIYYVRLNGLIKVGWSRDVGSRLRAYGPDVAILCVHEGTRQDETTLHRNLRPFLARGREWYQDAAPMQDIIARTIEQYGTGDVKVLWTRPAEPTIKLRKRR